MPDKPKPAAGRSYRMGNVGPGARVAQGDNISWIEGGASLPGGESLKQCRERFGGQDAQGTVGLEQPAEDMPDGAIFISYVRADLAFVLALKEDLEKAGLSVWLDRDRMGAGDTFDPKIQNNILRCALFLPVLSRNTEARTEAFFRREWRYALDRDLNIDPGTPFIIPVAIDDTREFTTLPRRFREIHITAAPEGRAPPEFINRLRRIGGRR